MDKFFHKDIGSRTAITEALEGDSIGLHYDNSSNDFGGAIFLP